MTTILDPQIHERLIADLDHVCTVANLPQQYVHESMKTTCGPNEVDWVLNFHRYRRESLAGAMLTGPNPEGRCMAICAALIRNFIDARIYPINSLLDAKDRNDLPNPTVLIIPNLYVTTIGTALPSWKIQSLYDILLARFTANRPTVVYVQDLKGMADAYGVVFAEHLKGHYKIV